MFLFVLFCVCFVFIGLIVFNFFFFFFLGGGCLFFGCIFLRGWGLAYGGGGG